MSQENKSVTHYHRGMNYVPYSPQNLVLVREDLGIDRKQLAEMCSKTESAIGQYERGERTPSVELIKLMSWKFSEFAKRRIVLYPEYDQAVIDNFANYTPADLNI